jgi:hypothetical protein
MKTRVSTIEEMRDKYSLAAFFDDWFKHERTAYVGRSRYIKIAKLLLKEISKLLIEKPVEFRLPKRLGMISVVKTGWERRPIDLTESTRQRKRVYRQGSVKMPVYTIKWHKENRYTDFINKPYYTFKATRGSAEEYFGRAGLSAFAYESMMDPSIKDFDRI